MKTLFVRSAVAVVSILWVIATGTSGAAWPVVVIPVLVLLWAVQEGAPPALSELAREQKVLVSLYNTIREHVDAIDGQLDRHGEHLAHLVDQQLHAMRLRGEVPWPKNHK